jgi:hypothetical protein
VIHAAWRPSATEELLLEATVGPVSGAARAFAAWRNAQDLDAIGEGSLRLLPLLVPRAGLLDPDDPAWPVIRGCYRRAFVRGQLLARRAAEAITLWDSASIPTLLLKGGALLACYGGNAALRPMNDYDVLVPRRQAAEAIRMLLANQWTASLPHPETLPVAYHGACFRSRDGFDIDLHWQALPSADDDDEAAIWTTSAPFTLHAVATRVPCAADLLTIVCAHGTQWSPASGVRWVADALHVLRGREAGFDWQRVLDGGRRWHVTLPLVDTLAYLGARWHVDLPSGLLHELGRVPVTAVDRHAYRALSVRPGFAAYLLRPWRRYRLRSRQLSPWRALPGFMTYLRVSLGRSRVREVPMEIARRALRFRRARRLGRV